MILLQILFRFNFITIGLLTFLFISCNKEVSAPIEKEQFTEIYARLAIINNLSVEKEHYDLLVSELLRDYKLDMAAINNSIRYYNQQPEVWVSILEEVRGKITDLKNERTKKISGPITKDQQPDSKRKPKRRITPEEKNLQ